MANEPVPVIEADGVGTLQPRHASHQIGVGRFEPQVIMVMVAHQAVGVNLPVRFLARFRQRFEKILSVHIIQENILAPVAPAHDVIHRRRILDSHLAWHQANPFDSCFRRPNVPPTNHQAERSLRPVVIRRKVVHGTRSSQGLENHSVLRSLFETARRQGKKAHHFFLDLFTKNTPQAQAALYRNPLPEKPPPPLRC